MEQFGIKILDKNTGNFGEEFILEAFKVEKIFLNGNSQGIGIFLSYDDAERVKKSILKYDADVILDKAKLDIILTKYSISENDFNFKLYEYYKKRFML